MSGLLIIQKTNPALVHIVKMAKMFEWDIVDMPKVESIPTGYDNVIVSGKYKNIWAGHVIPLEQGVLFLTDYGNPEWTVQVACSIISGKSLEYDIPFVITDDVEDILFDDIVNWFDIETDQLSPFGGTIVCAAVSNKNGSWLYNGDGGELMAYLSEEQIPLGVWNAVFEQKWAMHCAGPLNVVSDGQVDAALLFEDEPKGLKNQAHKVFAAAYDWKLDLFLHPVVIAKPKETLSYNVKRDNKNKGRRHADAPKELLYSYNVADTHVTGDLCTEFQVLLTKEPNHEDVLEHREWLLRGQTLLATLSNRGMRIDREALADVLCEYDQKIADIQSDLIDTAELYGMEDFNSNSSIQKRALIYDHAGYPVMKCTDGSWVHPSEYKKGWNGALCPSTDKEALGLVLKMCPGDELIELFTKLGHLTSVRDNFLTKCVEAGNFIHTNFSLTKLLTGQLSSTDPPMQNVPKTDVRRVLVSRFDGGMIGEWDYSQLHLRIMGNLSGCANFHKAYLNDEDLHTKTAANVILRIPEEEVIEMLAAGDAAAVKARDTAKRTNFSIIFEIGAHALAIKTGQTVKEAEATINGFYEYYPEIKQQIERQHQMAERNGWVQSPFGRVRHLPEVRSRIWKTKSKALRQAGDYLISNSGRSICLYAMILLEEAMRKRGMRSILVLQVHDSIVIDVYPGEEEIVNEIVQEYAVGRIGEYIADWMSPIPLKMDGSIGTSWYKEDKIQDFE